jgi:hypothetical protein
MKTTLEIDDELYRQAKAMAALHGRRMKDLIGEGLRLVLNNTKHPKTNHNPLGCLNGELAGRSVDSLILELRGPVDLPLAKTAKPKKSSKNAGG